jgi:D-alanyl-D-alanine endopeptidase (penicillin-binding protein 7)
MATFAHPAYTLPFRNTNHLVYRDNWNIQLTKTGFTNAAGHCLVMRTVINQRPVALVVMDAFGNIPTLRTPAVCVPGLKPGK